MSLPEGRYAQVGEGLRVHYHDLGQGDRAVLFLHGSGPGASGWSNFAANAEPLATAGFRCILADNLGYGLSSKPDLDYGMDFIADGNLALMHSLGIERYAIVGNSHGGGQAIRIALRHPERVSKLVLMAPGGLEEREVYMQMRGIRSMLRCVFGPEGLTLEGMQKVFERQLFDPGCVPADVVQQRYEVALTQPLRVFRTLEVPNQEDQLAELRCPVLGLWGANDLFCPVSGAMKLATRVPDCRVTVFNRCGHWVMVEKKALFDRLALDFLQHG